MGLARTLLIVFALTTLSAHGRSAAAQPPVEQRPTFTSAAELVVVHVTVKDRRGAYVKGLGRDNFLVFEDDVAQRIDVFSGEDAPVTVGFLLDSSGSMREGRERVMAAATAFAESSHGRDDVFALTFNEHVRAALPPSMPFTSDANVLRGALMRAVSAAGLTAMYDAIAEGLDYIAKGQHLRRVLVVVGDGGDNASKTTFDSVLHQAQSSNAGIYTVGIVDPLDHEADPSRLKRIARATGGESFFPRRIEDVDDVLRQIARDIRNSYTLGYVSSNQLRDGQFRQIRVVATDGDGKRLRVRARDGYRVGGSSGALD